MKRRACSVSRRGYLSTLVAGGSALLATACASLGGASGDSTPSKVEGPVTLELFTNAEESATTDQLLTMFRQRQSSIRVNYSYLQNGAPYRDKLKVQVASGTPPDVFYLEWLVYPPYVVQGDLAEIDGLARRDRVGIEDLWPGFAKQFTWKGKLQALGQNMQTMVTWYNADLFEQVGAPRPQPTWTWGDLLEAARRLTVRQGDRAERYGVTYATSIQQIPAPFIYMNGGRVFDRDEEPKASAMHEPAAVEALQWLADLRTKHRVAPTSEEESARGGNALASGTSIFPTGGVAIDMTYVDIPALQRNIKHFRWSALPLPKGKARQASISNSHAKVMARRSQHQEASWQLLRWLGGREGQAVAARLGGLPCYRSVAEKEWLLDPSMAAVKQAVLTSLAQGMILPITTKITDAISIINPILARMFNGQVAVQEGVAQLRAALDPLLAGG